MDQLARTIRLVTGLGMIAAGTSLTAPAAIEVHRWWQAHSVGSLPAGGVAAPSSETRPSGLAVRPAGGDPVAPQSWAVSEAMAEVSDPAGPVAIDRNYVLPEPPTPLPPVASSPPPPAAAALATAYRSTLDVPPPPLLDGHQPPPPAPGWSGRQPDPVHRPIGPTPQSMVYVIRDGDDLNGIASRFYGHPAAAAAIWEANRGLLSDPGILPIGATILLPHPDAMAGLAPAGSRPPAIEPEGFSGRFRAVGRTSP